MSGEQQDKQRAIEALERAGFRHDPRGHSWARASEYPDMPDIAGPSADKVCLTLMVSVERLPALLNPITKEQAEPKLRIAIKDWMTRHTEWVFPNMYTEYLLKAMMEALFPKATPTDVNPG